MFDWTHTAQWSREPLKWRPLCHVTGSMVTSDSHMHTFSAYRRNKGSTGFTCEFSGNFWSLNERKGLLNIRGVIMTTKIKKI